MSETKTDNLTLGITSIGDLLIQNRITEICNKDIFKTTELELKELELKIPDYQRPYKWKPKNAIRLLDDIEEARRANKEKYRVGTLILCKHEQGENGDNKQGKTDEKKNVIYDIVDGQQRVITFSLLLKCCKVKLGLKEENDKIVFLEQKLNNNSDNMLNVPHNYHALERRINLLEKSDLSDLYDYIKNNCEMIVIITDDTSEAFQFFDSQNARGKKLYPHDLLKAYHLREMKGLREEEKEEVVRLWEEMNQERLAELFSKYLYRLKMWIKGDKASKLEEHNIDIFKGISSRDTLPCALYHKSAFAYIEMANDSYIPLVVGVKRLSLFQIDAPVIAGKPFFEYAKHYYELMEDIQNNDKYVGYFVNENHIVETLNLSDYKNGAGNEYTRVLFDSAILLYIDRFCHVIPSKDELDYLDQFIVYAFIWAYSLRMQYKSLGWPSIQSYIQGNELSNSFNIYKMIAAATTPNDLFGKLSEELKPLKLDNVQFGDEKTKYEEKDKYSDSMIFLFDELQYLQDSSNANNTGKDGKNNGK